MGMNDVGEQTVRYGNDQKRECKTEYESIYIGEAEPCEPEPCERKFSERKPGKCKPGKGRPGKGKPGKGRPCHEGERVDTHRSNMTSQYQQTDQLASLRRSTHDVHQRLHRQPVLSCLVHRTLTIDQYLYALYALARFSESIEAQLAHSPYAKSVDYSTLLRQDYTVLSGSEQNPLPSCQSLQLPQTHSTHQGLLYVVLGSRLGGMAIARNVKRTLALHQGHGAAYFAGNASDIRARWSRFVTSLDDSCTDPSSCTSAALKGFRHLENYLWSLCGKNAIGLIKGHLSGARPEQSL